MGIVEPPTWDSFDMGVSAGARAGIARAVEFGMLPPSERLAPQPSEELASVLLGPLQSAQGLLLGEGALVESSQRFVEFFSELVTVASISRNTYNETELSEPEIANFLQQASWFLNSFRHP
jgi:hypothetical protein